MFVPISRTKIKRFTPNAYTSSYSDDNLSGKNCELTCIIDAPLGTFDMFDPIDLFPSKLIFLDPNT